MNSAVEPGVEGSEVGRVELSAVEPGVEGSEVGRVELSTVEPCAEGQEEQVVLEYDEGCVGAVVEECVILRTKLGSAIQQALGDSHELTELDRIHKRLKAKKQLGKLSREEIQKHQQLMSHLRSCGCEKRVELRDSIRQRELKHLNRHCELPIGNLEYKRLLAALGYVKKLLRHWEVSF